MIEINNLTRTKINFNLFKKTADLVLKREKGKVSHFSLALIGERRMRKLNSRLLKKNRPTDVLAFPEKDSVFAKETLGEIIICIQEVKKNSKRLGIGFKKEMARVFIHGILHLFGYDHEGSKEKAELMERKTNYYLGKIF